VRSGTFLSTILGIWWSLWNPYLFKIFATVVVLLWDALSAPRGYSRLPSTNPDTGGAVVPQDPKRTFELDLGVLVMATRLIKQLRQPGRKLYSQSAWFFSFAIVFFVFSSGFGGYLTTLVNPSDGSTALWSSDFCGIWDVADTLDNTSAIRRTSLDLQKEIRAGEYAESCYGRSDAFTSMRCGSFYSPRIKMHRSDPITCDAFDESIRMDGQTSVEFDTGPVSSGDIGVDSWHPYKFRRKTCCMPLKQDGFIRNESVNGVDTYYYYYASQKGTNYTYSTQGDPFQSGVGGYEVK
jgi:hypothetical protein